MKCAHAITFAHSIYVVVGIQGGGHAIGIEEEKKL